MMRHIIVLLFITLAASSCKKGDLGMVEKFVREVKADQYNTLQDLPAFNINHIDALFRHASDKQLVNRYPWPSYSSFYAGQKEVGLLMLYAIEVKRQPEAPPMRGVHIYDTNDHARKVTLDDVLPLYQAWWAQHKGKSAIQLQQLNPLEGTGLVWHGTSIAH